MVRYLPLFASSCASLDTESSLTFSSGVLAVTRALGDASVKEFVVGSPYTTQTTLNDGDEFMIVACDGLWDVAEDQDAVDLVRNIMDPQEASQALLKHALDNFSTDNLSGAFPLFSLISLCRSVR